VTRDAAVVRAGNERVLAARLADAQFFFREDRKHDLEHFARKLSEVVFQKKLGTILAKVDRLGEAAIMLAADLAIDQALVRRAADLCKADLATLMVGEFPELQGTMGRRYAALAGEPDEVCAAIEEHYMPRGASDDLPASEVGAVVGIADRLDTIVGCFAAGLAPTGSADPYGLRRAALGILRLFCERSWSVDLDTLVRRAADGLEGTLPVGESIVSDVLEFLRVRFRGLLADAYELPGDCVDAALAVGYGDPRDARLRAEAVSQLRQRDDFEPLAAAFKRVANILKGQSPDGTPDPALFAEEHERSLWSSFEGIRARVDSNLEEHNYVGALQVLSELKGPVDDFFEAVLVMDEDARVRDNRLAMLGRINDTFTRIADFRQLAV
jgi:glycyl-tRNA synthetase beta chain